MPYFLPIFDKSFPSIYKGFSHLSSLVRLFCRVWPMNKQTTEWMSSFPSFPFSFHSFSFVLGILCNMIFRNNLYTRCMFTCNNDGRSFVRSSLPQRNAFLQNELVFALKQFLQLQQQQIQQSRNKILEIFQQKKRREKKTGSRKEKKKLERIVQEHFIYPPI